MPDTLIPGPGDSPQDAALIRIRPFTRDDLDTVIELWSGYVTEGFAGNFAGPDGEPDAGVEYLVSLDRWGPGIAMPMLPGAARPYMPKEPSYEIRRHLTAMIGNPAFRCLVAEVQEIVAGFVTYSIRALPSPGERAGSIDELYVDPVARRAGIGRALVAAATTDLRAESVGAFQALVPNGKHYYAARKLFTRMGWGRDMVAFGHYE